MPPFSIRPATPEDAPALARVHVLSWQETYPGQMPPAFLERMTDGAALERRTANWARITAEPGQTVLLAEREEAVVAFASAGPAQDHPGVDGELYALYALRAVHGNGVGRALLRAAARELRAQDRRALALWVLDVNPTRGWYLRQGAREAGEKTVPLPEGGELREVRMVWDDLGALIGEEAG